MFRNGYLDFDGTRTKRRMFPPRMSPIRRKPNPAPPEPKVGDYIALEGSDRIDIAFWSGGDGALLLTDAMPEGLASIELYTATGIQFLQDIPTLETVYIDVVNGPVSLSGLTNLTGLTRLLVFAEMDSFAEYPENAPLAELVLHPGGISIALDWIPETVTFLAVVEAAGITDFPSEFPAGLGYMDISFTPLSESDIDDLLDALEVNGHQNLFLNIRGSPITEGQQTRLEGLIATNNWTVIADWNE